MGNTNSQEQRKMEKQAVQQTSNEETIRDGYKLWKWGFFEMKWHASTKTLLQDMQNAEMFQQSHDKTE